MRLARAWRDAGHCLHLVLGRDEGLPTALADGLAFDVLQEDGPVTTAAFETLWMIAKLPGRIRATRPDLIFCPGNSYAIVGVALKLILGAECPPIVLKVSNDLERNDMGRPARFFYRLWCRLQGRMIDRFVVLAEPMRAEVLRMMQVGRERVTVIENPVVTRADMGKLREARQAAYRPHRGRRFLAIGRLVPQKNFPLLVRAFARIAGPDDRLAILGEGSERAELEKLAGILGLGRQVLLPGHIEATDDWFAGADAFVLSSDYEGLPAVVVEALAAGVPVISTACSVSMPALLEGGALGLLTPAGDEIRLAEAMAAPQRPDPERAAAKADRFTVERAAPLYIRLFEELLADRAGSWGVSTPAASQHDRLWSSRVSR